MNDKIFISKNVLIALLLFTSAILTACWAAVGDRPFLSPLGGTSRAGYFVVTTTTSDSHDADLLWVVNKNNQTLSVYSARSDGAVNKLASSDLGQQFTIRTVR